MTNKFSTISRERLDTCHPDLIRLMEHVLIWQDITILCGTRGQEEQDKAFFSGNSKLRFPHSKHNSSPSMAVDIQPYGVCLQAWNSDRYNREWKAFCQKVIDTGEALGINVRNLGLEQGWDYYHFELR